MIVKELQTIHRIGDFKELHYRADQENIGALFHILRNQLYSKKLEAVIREYSTNAADIHAVTDQTRPFEVYLPTKITPTLRILDFGTGLSMPGFQDFISMGKSDKRESNILNGCLGIGCKSGFAYTDTFDIISRYENQWIEATSFVDESREGRLIITKEEKLHPDYPQGLEVIIPIREEDFIKIKEIAIKVLQAFESPPKLIQGQEVIPVKSRVTKTPIQIHWTPEQKNQKHEILSGNVAYPLDPEAAGIEVPPKHTLTLEMELGTFAFSASRESVEYTKVSKDGIKSHYQASKNKILKETQQHLDQFPNAWAANIAAWRKIRLEEKAKIQGPYNKLKIFNHLKWKEESLAPYNNLRFHFCLRWTNPHNPQEPGKWEKYLSTQHSPEKTLVVIPISQEGAIKVTKTRGGINPKRDTWILPVLKRAQEEDFEHIIIILQSKDWDYTTLKNIPKLAQENYTEVLHLPNKWEKSLTPGKSKPKKISGKPKVTPETKIPLKFKTIDLEKNLTWLDPNPNIQQDVTSLKLTRKAKNEKNLEWWSNISRGKNLQPIQIIAIDPHKEWEMRMSNQEKFCQSIFGDNYILLIPSIQMAATKEEKKKEIYKALKEKGIPTIQEAWKKIRPKNLICANDHLKNLVYFLRDIPHNLYHLKGTYTFPEQMPGRTYRSYLPSKVWVDKEQVEKEDKIWKKLCQKFPLLSSITINHETNEAALLRYLKIKTTKSS